MIHAPGRRRRATAPAAPAPVWDAAALIAAMSPAPDATRATLITDTFNAMAATTWWPKIDCWYFMAAHAGQPSALNWKANEFHLGFFGSPTFTVDRGWSGALNSRVDTNFSPSTAGRNYALNSATLSAWSVTQGAAGTNTNFLSIGVVAPLGGSTGLICPKRGTNTMNARINDVTSFGFDALGVSHGMFSINRTASNAREIFFNGASGGTGTTASTLIGAGNVILLPGDASLVSNLTMGQALIGGALTAAEVADAYTQSLAYLQAVGAI